MRKRRTKGRLYSWSGEEEILDRHSTKVYQRIVETENVENIYIAALPIQISIGDVVCR